MDLTQISEFDSSFNPTFPSNLQHIDLSKIVQEKEKKHRQIREQLPRGPIYSMRNEMKRLRSFISMDPMSSWCPEELASAGFFFTGLEESVQCFCCGLVLCKQSLIYTPIERHQQFNPECRFIKEEDCGNIWKYEIHPRAVTIGQSMDHIMIRVDRRESMKDEQSRLQSFCPWPAYSTLKPSVLAEAGFFFTGIRDVVQCFSCMGCLGIWEEEDDPWTEHSKWFPECEFLNSKKSEEKLQSKEIGSIPSTSNEHPLLEKVDILKRQLIGKYTSPSFYIESPFQDCVSIDLNQCFADISICLKDIRNKPIRQLLLADILSDLGDITMIEGEAGSGKTALLKKIALLWASGKCPILDKFSLVFFISLSSTESQQSVHDIICQQLTESMASVPKDSLEEIIKQLKDKVLILLDDYGIEDTTPGAIEELILKNPWNRVTLAITVSTNKSWKLRQFARNILHIQKFPVYSTIYLVKNLFSNDIEYCKEFVMKLEMCKNLTAILKTPLMILAHCSARSQNHEYSTFGDMNLFKTYLKYISLKFPLENKSVISLLSSCGELALKGLFQSKFQFSENDLKASGLDIDKAITFGLLSKFTAQRLQSMYCFFNPSFQEFLAGKRLSELLESEIPEDLDKGLHYLHQMNTFLKCFFRYSYFLKYASRISAKSTVKIVSYLLSMYGKPEALDCHSENKEHLKQHPELELEEGIFIATLRKQMKNDISSVCMNKLLEFAVDAAMEIQCLPDCAPVIMQFLAGKILTFSVSPVFSSSESILTFIKMFPESLSVLGMFNFILYISSEQYKPMDAASLSRYFSGHGVPTVEQDYSSAYLSLSNSMQKTDENFGIMNDFFSLFPPKIKISDSVYATFSSLQGHKVPIFMLTANDINSVNLPPDEFQKLAILFSTSDKIVLELKNCKTFVEHIGPAIKQFSASFKKLTLINTFLTTEEQDLLLEMSSLQSLMVGTAESSHYPETLIRGIHKYSDLRTIILALPHNPEVLDHLSDEFQRLDKIKNICFGSRCEIKSASRFVQFFSNFEHLECLRLGLMDLDCKVLVDSLAFCKKLEQLSLTKMSLQESDMNALATAIKNFTSLKILDLHGLKTEDKHTAETLALGLGSLINLQELQLPAGQGMADAATLVIEQFQKMPNLRFLSMIEILDDESIAQLADASINGYLKKIRTLELHVNANITESGWRTFFERAGNMPELNVLDIGRLYTQQIKSHATTVTAFVRLVSRLPSLVNIRMLGWLLDQDDFKMFNAMKERHPQAESLHIFWQWLLPFSANIEN